MNKQIKLKRIFSAKKATIQHNNKTNKIKIRVDKITK